MKLLPYNDVNKGIEKLHIYDIDIYGAETKKISRFKVEDEIYKYLGKYMDCLSSFSTEMFKFSIYTFLFFQFGEYGKELESALREMKEIYGKMETVNKNKESIILTILNNEQLEAIYLENIIFYRADLEVIFTERVSMNYDNNHIDKNLGRIKKYFEDNNSKHFTDTAKETIERFELSYYENNKIINLLSKKIIITDDEGNLLTLPENHKMIIDKTEGGKQEDNEDNTRTKQERLKK
jgi:hypothetical protein